MYYAIFIAFVIVLICSLVIAGSFLHRSFLIQYEQNSKLRRNIESAIVLSNEDPLLVETGKSQDIDLFGEESDIVHLEKKAWGVYNLLYASAHWKNLSELKTVLTGNTFREQEPIALYMADKQRYLSVSGNSLLRGSCYLPALGIRRAYIEGKSFMGKELVEGKTYKSNADLPEVNENRIQPEIDLIKNLPKTDSVYPIEALNTVDHIKQSFNQKTLTYFSNKAVLLQNIEMSGNIRIISTKRIIEAQSAILNNILLYAPNVNIQSGFAGCLQVFTTDTLEIGENCQFNAPTSFVMKSELEHPIISISKNCIVKGDVFQTVKSKSSPLKPEIHISKDVRIEGVVYTFGVVDLQGEILGSLYCNGFVLRTPGALYENHILDAKIDYSGLPAYYSGNLLYPLKCKQKTIMRLD